ncbi:hypothetical protein [Asticcacaulis solisilvae]|uniref:hypothetical protein n=1 Tax=Asticcacaulis solisilvae TaxID=1217274 RepID=UPI003FD7D2EA
MIGALWPALFTAGLAVWLGLAGYGLARGISGKVLRIIIVVFPFFAWLIFLIPASRRASIAFRILFWVSAAVWLVGAWRPESDLDLRFLLLSIPTVAAACGLLPALDKVYDRWKAIRSPAIRAAVAIAAGGIGALTFLYMIVRVIGPVDWHGVFVDNWGLTLVLVYLPIMAFIAMGFYWRRKKNK